MILHNARLYRKAANAKRGRDRSPKVLLDLKAWVANAFAVQVVLIVYDTIDIGPCAGNPRLNIIVETDRDFSVVHQDWLTLKPGIASSVASKFSKLVADTHEFSSENLLVLFDNFSCEAMRIATQSLMENDRDSIVGSFASEGLWTINAISREIVAFFLTEKQVNAVQKSSIHDRLTDKCFRAVKKYDEFGYFSRDAFPIRYDSKEVFDKKYRGNWYWYFK